MPWVLAHRFEQTRNRWAFHRNRLLHRFRAARAGGPGDGRPSVLFVCGFHGYSGGMYAIANIANMLATDYDVQFASHPQSPFNPRLGSAVRIVSEPHMRADLFVCDVTCDHGFLRELRRRRKPCVVTCHGQLNDLHGLTPEYVRTSLSLASKVHFVSEVQQESFQLPAGTYEVIANTAGPIRKTRASRDAGTVGNLADPRKNVDEAISIALESDAEHIHLWGADTARHYPPRVVPHGWERDKETIYNSFDVLVFLSRNENLPMVVIEALSAGIPCLLSSIPAMAPFKDCPGVRMVDESNRSHAAALLNDLLNRADELGDSIKAFWEERFSQRVILARWKALLSTLDESKPPVVVGRESGR